MMRRIGGDGFASRPRRIGARDPYTLRSQGQGERNLRFLSPLESPFFPFRSEPTSRNHDDRVPVRRPSPNGADARTVLAGKGPLRRAKNRRALARSAPFWPERNRDGRLRREHDRGRDPVSKPRQEKSTTYRCLPRPWVTFSFDPTETRLGYLVK